MSLKRLFKNLLNINNKKQDEYIIVENENNEYIEEKKNKLLPSFEDFKQTKVYKKQMVKIQRKMIKTEEKVKKIKKLRESIVYKIEFLKENLVNLDDEEKEILNNYFNFCFYYISNFSNLKMLKILNKFLNYIIKVYIQKKELNLDTFKKQVIYVNNYINKKIEASKIFKNFNIINTVFNNYLLQNKINIDVKDIDKNINTLLKIEKKEEGLNKKEKEAKNIDNKIEKASKLLEKFSKYVKD